MHDMIHDTGRFATPHASKYLQQLCKHFGHKTEVRFDSESGEVALSAGPAELSSSDSELRVTVHAPDEPTLAKARSVIDSHLARFAFREEFEHMTWEDAPAAA